MINCYVRELCFGRFGSHFVLVCFAAAVHLFHAGSGKLYALFCLLCAWLCCSAPLVFFFSDEYGSFSWFPLSCASLCSIHAVYLAAFLVYHVTGLSKMSDHPYGSRCFFRRQCNVSSQTMPCCRNC